MNDACMRVDRLMEGLLTGEGDTSGFASAEEHMRGCQRCRAAWGDLLMLATFSERMPVQLPAGRTWEELVQRTRCRLAAAAVAGEKSSSASVRPLAFAILLGCFLMAVVPAGIVAAADIVLSMGLSQTVLFWKYYGIAFAGQLVFFQLLAGLLFPLVRYPARLGRRSRSSEVRTYFLAF